MKKHLSIIFVCYTLFLSLYSSAQPFRQGTGNVTPGGYFDIVFDRFGNQYSLSQIAVSDAARLHISGKDIPPASSAATAAYTGCLPGYFRIYLEAGCGMDLYATDVAEAARLGVLCQVLTDIANFIPSPCTTTGQTVNIWVKGGLTTGLGVATPFFNIPYSLIKTGIVDNTVWETLNSGVDAFKNIAPPLVTSGGGTTGASGGGSVYFHGSIALNFGGSVTWHTDLSTPPASGEQDLYTVTLHEMVHIMGFCTIIDYDGRSVFDMYNVPPVPANYQYYSRYDMQLQSNAGVPLITNSSSGCDMYQYSFNPAAATTPNSILSPGGTSSAACSGGFYTGGGETGNTVCTTSIKYMGGFGAPIPVYTPACFERGGSLSHFDDQCYVPSGFCPGCTTTNCEYFVLSNEAPNPLLGGYSATTNPGLMKRYLTPEERQVLCDIGYPVLTTFGNAANLNDHSYGGTNCPGRQVVGFNDGITDTGTYAFSATSGMPVLISGPSLGTTILDNDRTNGVSMSSITGATFKCLEVMTGTGTVSTSTGDAGTDVTYTAGATDFGVELLRYMPVSVTGVEGNITYVYVFVGNPGCVPTACNLVVNGGFENPTLGAYGGHLPGEYCWSTFNYAPWLLATDASAGLQIPNYTFFMNGIIHPLSPASNNHYVAMYNAESSFTPGVWGSSSIQEQLSAPLDSGQQYTITFWGLFGNGGETPVASHLQFAVGDMYPLIGTLAATIPTRFMPPGFTSLAEFTIAPNNYLWQSYSLTVTYTGHSNASTLFIQGAPWDDADSIYRVDSVEIIGIDDISIVPAASACLFSLPGPIQPDTPPFNLFSIADICVTGGTFNWPTMPILTGGIPTTSTSNTFNPANAYAASLATGGSGFVPVSYTYTTAAGCVQTVYTTLHIDTAATGLATIIVQPLHIYPNPANDVLYIDISSDASYRLLNIIGQVMLQGPLTPSYCSISVQSLSPGIYVLEITDNYGKRKVTKIIKQ